MRLFSPRVPVSVMKMAIVALLLPVLSSAASITTRESVALSRRADQVAEKLCSWRRPQSAIIRDTVYIDGGDIQYTAVMSDGSEVAAETEIPRQLLYSINLTHPFDTTRDNVSLVMDTIPKYAVDIMPNIQNGHMLANDYEFVLYGGITLASDTVAQQPADWAYARYIYQQGDVVITQDWKQLDINNNVTRYISDGAYVNVPSENLAFVFGGERSPNWGLIDTNHDPNITSSNLITLDLSTSKAESFTNRTTPSNVTPRTGGEVAWIPVGGSGALIAFGGMDYMSDLELYTRDDINTFLENGQNYIRTVQIYDVEARRWYSQETTGDVPPPLMEFCSVVASSSDLSTHEIFIYGGRTGIPVSREYLNNTVYDDVYTLSIPSMVWTKVYSGAETHARREHRCQRVADNLMMVVGGRASQDTGEQSCPGTGLIQVFNLNTLEWVQNYDPALNAPYVANSTITTSRDATQKATWNSSALPDLFNTAYNKTITKYWPFATVQNPNLITLSGASPANSTGATVQSGLPSYVPPLLGSIFGLLVVIIILCGILFWLRRKRLQTKRLQSDSAASTVRKNRQTWSWLLGVYGDEKNRERDFDETPSIEHTNPMEGIADGGMMSPRHEPQPNPIETEGRQVFEMPDTSLPQELPSPPTATRRVNFEVTPVETNVTEINDTEINDTEINDTEINDTETNKNEPKPSWE